MGAAGRASQGDIKDLKNTREEPGGIWGMNVSGRKYTLRKGPGWERSDPDVRQSAGWAGWRSKTYGKR